MITSDNTIEQEAINLMVEKCSLALVAFPDKGGRAASFERKVKTYREMYGVGFQEVYEAIPINMLPKERIQNEPNAQYR